MPFFLTLALISQVIAVPEKVSVDRTSGGSLVVCRFDGKIWEEDHEYSEWYAASWAMIIPSSTVPRNGAKGFYTRTPSGPDTLEIVDNMDDEYFGLALEDSIRGFGCGPDKKTAAKLKSLAAATFKERNRTAERAIREHDVKVVYWSKFSRDPEVRHRGELIWTAIKRRL